MAGAVSSFGILEMTLRDGGDDVSFLAAQDEPAVQDAGSGTCH